MNDFTREITKLSFIDRMTLAEISGFLDGLIGSNYLIEGHKKMLEELLPKLKDIWKIK